MKTSDARKSLVVIASAVVLGLAAAATLASAAPARSGGAAASPCPSPSSSSSKPSPSGITTIIPTGLPTGGGGSSSAKPSTSASASGTPKPSQSASTAAPAAKGAPAASTPTSSATASESVKPSASDSSGASTPAPCQTSPGGKPQHIKSTITIESHRQLHFSGVVRSSEKGCYRQRDVVLKKVHKGKDPAEGTDVTNKKGDWTIVAETKTGGGKYYAVATKKVLRPNTDGTTVCTPARSKEVKAG